MKLRRIIFTCIVFMMLPMAGLWGQEAPRRLVAEFGIDAGYFKDELYSPLNYNKTGWRVDVRYQSEPAGRKHLLETGLLYGNGNIKYPRVTHFTGKYHLGKLYFNYLRRVHEWNDKSALFIGGGYISRLERAYIGKLKYMKSFRYDVFHGLNLKLLYRLDLNYAHRLGSSLGIPVAGLLVRNPFNGYDGYYFNTGPRVIEALFDGKPATVNRYFEVSWDAEYSRRLSPSMMLGVKYGLCYRKIPDTHRMIDFSNNISVNLHLRL